MKNPNHPNYQQQQATHDSRAHDKHSGNDVSDFCKRFIICSLATIPVLALSHMIQLWLGFDIIFPYDKYVLALFSTFIFVYGAQI